MYVLEKNKEDSYILPKNKCASKLKWRLQFYKKNMIGIQSNTVVRIEKEYERPRYNKIISKTRQWIIQNRWLSIEETCIS